MCLDFVENNSGVTFEFNPQDFKKLNEVFHSNNFTSTISEVAYVPGTPVMIDLEQLKQVSNLIEALEELDDIQNVYTNFDIDEKLLDS